MEATKRFAACPATLSQGSGAGAVSWQHDPAWAARPDDEVDDRYQLIAIDAAGDDCAPVYRQDPETAPAVATGRLFLRLRDGLEIEQFAPPLEALGLGVETLLGWAPHAAWVAALDGDPCHALNQLDVLSQREEVAHVEAQLLQALHRR